MNNATNSNIDASPGNGPLNPELRFGLFDLVDHNPAMNLGELYRQRMRIVAAADQLGFDHYFVAEHHLQPTGEVASPSVFLAAVAQCTDRIHIGPLVYQLSLYHPVRLLEEICMLDHLSDGRLDVGLGRGFSPWELEAYNVAGDSTRSIFAESLAIILEGLTTGHIDRHEGEHFTVPEVELTLRPVQRPYPQLWYPTSNPESIDWVARRGLHLVTSAGSDTAKTGQMHDLYHRTWQQHRGGADWLNHGANAPFVGGTRLIYIGATEESARREAAAAYLTYATSQNKQWLEHGDHRLQKLLDVDKVLDDDLPLLCGTAESVTERLQSFLDGTGANYFLGTFAFGSLDEGLAIASMERFAQEVAPNLKRTYLASSTGDLQEHAANLQASYEKVDIV